MPRKPKVEKQTITVVVNGKPVAVILHPPTGTRKSWYAYWPGLVTSKSTGQAKLEDAVVVAEDMVKSGGKKATVADAVLTDEEFEPIQRPTSVQDSDPPAKAQAAKSLESCLDAIAPSGRSPASTRDAGHSRRLCRVSAQGLDLPRTGGSSTRTAREDVACSARTPS